MPQVSGTSATFANLPCVYLQQFSRFTQAQEGASGGEDFIGGLEHSKF